jgi:hypothetical protein
MDKKNKRPINLRDKLNEDLDIFTDWILYVPVYHPKHKISWKKVNVLYFKYGTRFIKNNFSYKFSYLRPLDLFERQLFSDLIDTKKK